MSGSKTKKSGQSIPTHILELGPPPEPSIYSVYEKLKELVYIKRNPAIKGISDLSYYVRGNKDGLRMSEYHSSFSLKELSIFSQIFKIPVEFFASPMTATDYLLSISKQGDTVSLLDQVNTLKDLVKTNDNLLNSKNTEMKNMKKTILLLQKETN